MKDNVYEYIERHYPGAFQYIEPSTMGLTAGTGNVFGTQEEAYAFLEEAENISFAGSGFGQELGAEPKYVGVSGQVQGTPEEGFGVIILIDTKDVDLQEDHDEGWEESVRREPSTGWNKKNDPRNRDLLKNRIPKIR